MKKFYIFAKTILSKAKEATYMKVGVVAAVVFFMGILMEVSAMNKEWFQTWDRSEYQEWAIEIPEGYLLHIIREQAHDYLVVQAKLIMGSKGLPGFEVIESRIVTDKSTANDCIQFWRSERNACMQASN